MPVFNVISPILVLLLLALAFFLPRHIARRHGSRVSRGLRKRHLVVRIVCGALAALILGAVTVGTMQDVQRCYESDEERAAAEVHVPSRPATPITMTKRHEIEVPPSRLIYHVVLAHGGADHWRPVAVGEKVIDYARGGPVSAQGSLEVDGVRMSYRMSLREWMRWHDPDADDSVARAIVDYNLRVRRPWGGSWSSGGSVDVPLDGLRHVGECGPASPFGKSPLSIARGPRRSLHLFHGFSRADADDPLETTTLADFVQTHHAAMAEAVEENTSRRYSRPSSAEIPMRVLALADHIGASALLFAVACLLLVQLFRRRELALVVVAVALVLYVAALDRWALGTHLSYLADPSAPLQDRLTACDQATDTFFYCPTAVEGLRAVAEDANAPVLLRDRARRTAQVIDDSVTRRGRM